jgi:osmoprotectant transport system permease protein
VIPALSAAAAGSGLSPQDGGPVVPNFSETTCGGNQTFCWGWVQDNWGGVLAPALVQHIYVAAIAVVAGLIISLAAAIVAYRQRWFEQGFSVFSTFLYTIPSLVFFLLWVPVTGLGLTTIELGLTGYTFLLMFRNALTGLRSVPPGAIKVATGMGMTRTQVMWRVNIPLAIPSIMAGVRISAVTVISLATIAAYVAPLGLGKPIFFALHISFTTELLAAGVLAILLAFAADFLLVLLQRAITPWVRAAKKGVH